MNVSFLETKRKERSIRISFLRSFHREIDKYQNQAVIVIFLDVSVDKIRATRRLVNDFRECTEEKSAKKRG